MTAENEIDLSQSIESNRDEITNKFNLTDEQFNLLIKNVILDTYDKLKLRLSTDDPIFALILSQKNVLDYYSLLITQSLNAIPTQIGNAIDDRLEQLNEKIHLIGIAFDDELNAFKKGFNAETLELNNNIITSFDKFINKKIDELNQEFKKIIIPNNQPMSGKNNQTTNKIMIFIAILNLIIICCGFIYIGNNKESSYQLGLFKGFESVKKILPAEQSSKVESIIIDAIDEELRR